MSAWTNIEVPRDDAEIISINKIEDALGNISHPIRQIRELITRFEVCHFKFRQHLDYILKSIEDLQPGVDPGFIGQYHIQHGDQAWKSDKTGRSIMGQQYLWALNNWMDNSNKKKPPEYNVQLKNEIKSWLGERSSEKERLVRLLVARLEWDWKSLEEISRKSLEEISHEGDDRGLEYQICRMDICHFAFPVNLINVIRGIGKMKPVEKFVGCGSHNTKIKKGIQREFDSLNKRLTSRFGIGSPDPGTEDLTRIWLYSCLAKTIKEQVGLAEAIQIPSSKF